MKTINCKYINSILSIFISVVYNLINFGVYTVFLFLSILSLCIVYMQIKYKKYILRFEKDNTVQIKQK